MKSVRVADGKSKRKTRLIITGILVGLFVVLNVVQFPRGPYFDCYGYGESGYRIQYGFPFVFVQRSVPTTNCKTPAKATLDDISNYSNHHIFPVALLGNLALWGILGCIIVKIVERRT